MPRPEQLPTPASSTELKGKDGLQFSSSASSSSSLQISFELPPPAVPGTDSQLSSASSYHPTSPKSPAIPSSEVVKIRRRPSAAQASTNKDAFALPPPPTRSRKIIQMKPRRQSDELPEVTPGPSKTAGGKMDTSPPKKKQPSSTSVAGRKIARKTAHSLIERRRRSKMNEEFGVLKDMIPACTGEMHKLAILQASIDYVRYLEDCVAKLKAENGRSNTTPISEQHFALPPPASNRGSYSGTRRQYGYDEQSEDVEMGNSSQPSPTYSTPIPHSARPSASPALMPKDARSRQDSYSSISDQRHYSFSASSTTSPALDPAAYVEYVRSAGSALPSPALGPLRDQDQEATAALLMLNTDRRGTYGSISGRGMSVKDLLST